MREKRGCTRNCKCKGCSNKRGVRPPPSTTKRRILYDNQRQPLEGKPSNDVLKESGEPITDGHLTKLEVLLLKTIVIYFIIHGLEISPSRVLLAYKNIYTLSQTCESVQFPLFNRNIDTIKRFLTKILSSLQLLKALFHQI